MASARVDDAVGIPPARVAFAGTDIGLRRGRRRRAPRSSTQLLARTITACRSSAAVGPVLGTGGDGLARLRAAPALPRLRAAARRTLERLCDLRLADAGSITTTRRRRGNGDDRPAAPSVAACGRAAGRRQRCVARRATPAAYRRGPSLGGAGSAAASNWADSRVGSGERQRGAGPAATPSGDRAPAATFSADHRSARAAGSASRRSRRRSTSSTVRRRGRSARASRRSGSRPAGRRDA